MPKTSRTKTNVQQRQRNSDARKEAERGPIGDLAAWGKRQPLPAPSIARDVLSHRTGRRVPES